jgi:hypothetical protein
VTAPTPVDRVAEVLAGARYRRVRTPLEIANLKFDFPIAFVGTSPSPDLVLVADTAFDDERRILKKMEGIARAMDVVQSRRPITVVLTGPRPSFDDAGFYVQGMSRTADGNDPGERRGLHFAELVGRSHALDLARAKRWHCRPFD